MQIQEDAPLYVYALLPAAQAPEGGLGVGIGEAEVATVAVGGLVALTSAAPPGDGPIDPTRRNMLLHTKLLERALANATVLPLRFGTVAPNRAALLRWMTGAQARFLAALAEIDDRVELGVKASWLDGVVYDDIVAADPALRAVRDRLRDRSPSETYYERIELGRAVEAALAQHRARATAGLLATLSPLAEREAELAILHANMIFNRAFLVRRGQERAFDSAMEQLSATHAQRMSFRYVGPVPPYNFVNVRTDWAAAA